MTPDELSTANLYVPKAQYTAKVAELEATVAQQADTISTLKRGIRDVAIWFENQPHDRDGGYSALHCIEQMRALVEDASAAKLPKEKP